LRTPLLLWLERFLSEIIYRQKKQKLVENNFCVINK
jgi:hypothetical protein